MSGGSWNYAYRGVEEMADGLEGSPDALRSAFGSLLRKVATAMHDIEWVDSADYSNGDEEAAIRAALGDNAPALALGAAAANLSKAIQRASETLAQFGNQP